MQPPAGYIDLHCHWLPGIDDGATDLDEGVAILRGLGGLGFGLVTATPHMRPGLFDNEAAGIRASFEQARASLPGGLPRVELGCEHYFDDVVVARIQGQECVPLPGGRAILLEFYDQDFPKSVQEQLFRMRAAGLRPVIAHPERYQRIWQEPRLLEELVDRGAVALLDIAALAGKYGRKPEKVARRLLDEDLYYAACSDAHRAADVALVERGMRELERGWGQEELGVLLRDGPLDILEGSVRD